MLDVYVAPLPARPMDSTPLLPRERQEQIDGVSNAALKKEKYFVWRLLERALSQSLGIKMENTELSLTESGKWIAHGFYISLSHRCEALAVAVSSAPVGVDVEPLSPERGHSFARRIMTANELAIYESLPECAKADFTVRCWTLKESIFKKQTHPSPFIPRETESNIPGAYSQSLELAGAKYCLSVASDTHLKANVITVNNL